MGGFIGAYYKDRRVFDVGIPDHPISIGDAVEEYLGLEDIAAESEADQRRLRDMVLAYSFIISENGRYRVDIDNMRFAGTPYIVKERLTRRSEDGSYYYPACFRENTCGGVGASRKCLDCEHSHRYCKRLGRYEDTGLTPELIRKMIELFDVPEKLNILE